MEVTNTAVAEIDYLYQNEGKLSPIELKSGVEGRLRSLHMFMNMAPHNMAIRFYAGELSISVLATPGQNVFYLLNLPLFSCITN